MNSRQQSRSSRAMGRSSNVAIRNAGGDEIIAAHPELVEDIKPELREQLLAPLRVDPATNYIGDADNLAEMLRSLAHMDSTIDTSKARGAVDQIARKMGVNAMAVEDYMAIAQDVIDPILSRSARGGIERSSNKTR